MEDIAINYYIRGIEEQDVLVRRNLEEYFKDVEKVISSIKNGFKDGRLTNIIMVGMGSSLYAARAVISVLSEAGYPAFALNAYEVLHNYPRIINEKSLVILISQSGQTPEILELANKIDDRAGEIIACVNIESSPLSSKFENTLLLRMGIESHISNKSYYGQVVMLGVFACCLIGEDKKELKNTVTAALNWAEIYKNSSAERSKQIIDFMAGVDSCDILADDALLGTALQIGLIWREVQKIHTTAFSISDYAHGWFEICDTSNYFAVILTSEPDIIERQMIDKILSCNGKVLLISSSKAVITNPNLLNIVLPETKKQFTPLYHIIPAYYVAGYTLPSEK